MKYVLMEETNLQFLSILGFLLKKFTYFTLNNKKNTTYYVLNINAVNLKSIKTKICKWCDDCANEIFSNTRHNKYM